MSDRGLHPDLVEETLAEREAEPAPQQQPEPGGPSRRSRASRRSAQTSEAPPSGAPAGEPDVLSGGEEQQPASSDRTEGSPDQGDDNAPDWRTAESPAEALKRLARSLPSEELAKDETLSGLIGQMADRRARDLQKQQERDALERAKRDAAANNDLYTLGELTQRDYAAQIQAQQAAQGAAPFMASVENFQRSLPETVQQRVSGQQFESVEHYLKILTDEAVKLGVEQELRKRESALRKSVLSEVNGDEPVPERENGTPSRVREVTDEQIADMSLREYDALFDENGHPKPGVRHRSTRGIPIRRQ